MVGKHLEIVDIRGESGATRFRERNDERIDGGTSTSPPAQQRSAPRQRLGNPLRHVACPQETVGERVAASVTLQALDEDDRRDYRRPEALFAQRKNQRRGLTRPFSKPGDCTGIEDEHAPSPGFTNGALRKAAS